MVPRWFSRPQQPEISLHSSIKDDLSGNRRTKRGNERRPGMQDMAWSQEEEEEEEGQQEEQCELC